MGATWCDGAVTDAESAATGSPAPTPAELEALAVELALGAAEVVRRAAASRGASGAGLQVHSKSTATDLVTAADEATETWLRDQIAQRRPGDAVLGEEGGSRAGHSGVRWVLDPIDGTVNFVLGIPHYAVSVAAELDGRVVAGAVCNAASGELFRAHLGGGSYLGERRLSGPRDVPLARAVVGTGFAYAAPTRARQAAVAARLLPVVADIRRLGSASLDLCAVAAGRLDAYFEYGLHPWYYAAGVLIATEAGCVASGLHGRPAGVFTAVAPPGVMAEFTALLEQLAADEVEAPPAGDAA